MSVSRTWAVALNGITGAMVEVEADISAQQPGFDLIGLPDKALGEAARRVGNACVNQQVPLPRRHITVNLSPASLPKRGAGFDVAIAIASLATEYRLDPASLERTVHVGELGLDGRLRPIVGVLPSVLAAARAGWSRVVVPWANADEARLVEGVEVVAAMNLADVARAHGAEIDYLPCEPSPGPLPDEPSTTPLDLADVVGQRTAVDALIVAAVGGHHVLITGPPGAGKTMLAARLPGLLPPLDAEAALEVAAVRSLSGRAVTQLPRVPPFEAPHHTATVPALIGGGSGMIRPGSVARAAHGILFLDEAAEFPSVALDALRQPLESGTITIHRASAEATFPARFQLLMAMNPCPCGNRGVRGAQCDCPPSAIRRYAQRLSRPLLDRVDIELPMTRVTAIEAGACVTTAEAAERVAAARERTRHRLRGTLWRTNAQLPGTWLRRDARLARETTGSIDVALQRGLITLRGYDRILRVAWSLADLAAKDRPGLEEIGGALILKRGMAT